MLAAWAEKKKARRQSDAVRRPATPPLVEAAAAGAKVWLQVSSMSSGHEAINQCESRTWSSADGTSIGGDFSEELGARIWRERSRQSISSTHTLCSYSHKSSLQNGVAS